MQRLSEHDHIIKFYDSYTVVDECTWFVVVMEYAQGGDLHGLINERKADARPFLELVSLSTYYFDDDFVSLRRKWVRCVLKYWRP